MRRLLVLLLITATACSGSTEQRSLSGALETIPLEVDAVVSSLHQVLDEAEDTPPGLFRRIQDLRLASDAAVLYDRVGRVTAPAVAADLDRYVEFVGDLLLATGDLDAAVATADTTGIALAWLRIEAGSGSLAVALDLSACPLVTPSLTVDLCPPQGPTDYDAGLDDAIRRFLASYRPVMRLPAAFDDQVRNEVVAVLAPEVVAVIDLALEHLAALQPPSPHIAVHRAFVDHLTGLREIWSAVDASGDRFLLWLALEVDLSAEACAAEDEFAAGRALLGAVEAESTIPALGALLFDGEGIGCP